MAAPRAHTVVLALQAGALAAVAVEAFRLRKAFQLAQAEGVTVDIPVVGHVTIKPPSGGGGSAITLPVSAQKQLDSAHAVALVAAICVAALVVALES